MLGQTCDGGCANTFRQWPAGVGQKSATQGLACRLGHCDGVALQRGAGRSRREFCKARARLAGDCWRQKLGHDISWLFFMVSTGMYSLNIYIHCMGPSALQQSARRAKWKRAEWVEPCVGFTLAQQAGREGFCVRYALEWSESAGCCTTDVNVCLQPDHCWAPCCAGRAGFSLSFCPIICVSTRYGQGRSHRESCWGR